MKKNNKSTFIILFLAVAILSYSFVFNRYINAQYISPAEAEKSDKTAYEYVLSEYNGKLAVFSYGGSLPIEVFDTSVSDLPENDRLQLEKGITVSDKTSLQKLVEDYTS